MYGDVSRLIYAYIFRNTSLCFFVFRLFRSVFADYCPHSSPTANERADDKQPGRNKGGELIVPDVATEDDKTLVLSFFLDGSHFLSFFPSWFHLLLALGRQRIINIALSFCDRLAGSAPKAASRHNERDPVCGRLERFHFARGCLY